MSGEHVYVLVDPDGLIVGASVANGRATERSFLEPVPPSHSIHRVVGPVIFFKPLSEYAPADPPEEL